MPNRSAIVLDQDTCEVVTMLRDAVQASGLSQARFSRAVGTTPGRLSAYLRGAVRPSAFFCLRARRLGEAMRVAAEQGAVSAPVAALRLREAIRSGEIEQAWRVVLTGRDDLRRALSGGDELMVAAWEVCPPETGSVKWDTLLATVAEREFVKAGRGAPSWTKQEPLDEPWAPANPLLRPDRLQGRTPEWLADRNIFVPERDLATASKHPNEA